MKAQEILFAVTIKIPLQLPVSWLPIHLTADRLGDLITEFLNFLPIEKNQ